MPKLTKFPLSKKNIVLVLIISSVPLAIFAYPNFSQQTRTEIKILDKQTYLEKYKEQDPIENTEIDKDNIIFSSKEDIINFLPTELEQINIEKLDQNKFIVVDHYHKKYGNTNLTYIYFKQEEQEENILKKVFLFWDINKIKNEPIDIKTIDWPLYKETKIEIEDEICNKYSLYEKNINDKDKEKFKQNLRLINKPLYYQNKKIIAIYFDIEQSITIQDTQIQNYDIENLLNLAKSAKKIYLFIENNFRKRFSAVSKIQTLKQNLKTVKDIKKMGFYAKHLKEAGYTLKELKEAYTLKELKEAYTLKELKEAYTLKELKEAGYKV